MSVNSKPDQCILEVLKQHGPLGIDDLYEKLCTSHQFSQRDIKETIWKLLNEGKIAPNKQWHMILID
jgi:hypothetical protein